MLIPTIDDRIIGRFLKMLDILAEGDARLVTAALRYSDQDPHIRYPCSDYITHAVSDRMLLELDSELAAEIGCQPYESYLNGSAVII